MRRTKKLLLCPVFLLSCLPVSALAGGVGGGSDVALLDAAALPEVVSSVVAEQPSLLESIRMSIAISLAECEAEGSCDLVRDGELDALMHIVDAQVEHLRQGSTEVPEDTFARYQKLKEAYATYRPQLRDINLGISQLTEGERVQLDEEVDKLLDELLDYELALPEGDDESELIASEEGLPAGTEEEGVAPTGSGSGAEPRPGVPAAQGELPEREEALEGSTEAQ